MSSELLSGFCSHSLPLPPYSGFSRTEDQALLLLLQHRPHLATLLNSLVAYSQHLHRATRHPMDKESLTIKVPRKEPLTHLNKRSPKCSKAATLSLCNNLHIPPPTRRDLQAITTINLKASPSRRTTHPIALRCLHLRRNSVTSRLLLHIKGHKRWNTSSIAPRLWIVALGSWLPMGWQEMYRSVGILNTPCGPSCRISSFSLL